MIIYKTTNLVNGKIYVGFHSKNNKNYLGSGRDFKKALKDFGRNNFIRETLEVVNKFNKDERERFWIKKLNSQNPNIGYNIRRGGGEWPKLKGIDKLKLGRVWTKEEKKKHSDIMKVSSHWTKKGINNFRYGKKHTKETKNKISDSLLNKHPMKGKHFSKDFGRKVSKELSKKCIIEGIEYDSPKKASLDLKIPYSTIKKRIYSKTDRFKNYVYKGEIE